MLHNEHRCRSALWITITAVIAFSVGLGAHASAGDDCSVSPSVHAVGVGSQGTDGVPSLVAVGLPAENSSFFSLSIAGGTPGSPARIYMSTGQSTFFVPALDATFYPDLAALHFYCPAPLDGDGEGGIDLSPILKFVCGQTLVAQGVIPDPAATGGIALTPALVIQFGDALTAPMVSPTPAVTNKASVVLSGVASVAGATIRVEGGTGGVQTQVGADLSFNVPVPLKQNAKNTLYVTEVAGAVISPPAVVVLVQDQQAPELIIEFPAHGAVLSTSSINVAGTVSDKLSGFLGLEVTVNGLLATVNVGVGTNGTFDLQSLPLGAKGPVNIVVCAQDAVGNIAKETITVNFQPPTGAVVVALSGDDQSANVGQELTDPIVVRAQTLAGIPLAGKPVQFAVTKSDGVLSAVPGGPAAQTLTVLTGTTGEARAFWTLGSDAGMGNNRVAATSPLLQGSAFFCASATPDLASLKINVGSGNTQVAQAGGTAPQPLQVWVNDGQNGLAGVAVTFAVVQGQGQVLTAMGSDPSKTVSIATDATGHAQVLYVAGDTSEVGLVRASVDGAFGLPATFQVRSIAPDQQGTRLSGVVRDNSLQGLGGAMLWLHFAGGQQAATMTDSDGRFTFHDLAASGAAELVTDGATATTLGGAPIDPGVLAFPHLAHEIFVVAEAANVLPRPILLPRLDPASIVAYDGTETIELTVPGMEGLAITVPQGTLVTAPGGQIASPSTPIGLSLSPVHVDDIPMPLPDGASAPFAWTLQPGGTTFDPPLPIRLPNMAGLAPGAQAYILVFDHDTGAFEIVAPASVSADGAQIASNPGTGLAEAGWGGFCPPYPPTTEAMNCAGAAAKPLLKKALNSAVSAIGTVFGIKAFVDCGTSVIENSGTFVGLWNAAKLDGDISCDEKLALALALQSAKSIGVDCVGAFAASKNPCEIANDLAGLVGIIGGTLDEAVASGCLSGPVAQSAATGVGVLGSYSGLFAELCGPLDTKELAGIIACGLMEQIAGTLESLSPCGGNEGSDASLELGQGATIGEIDDLLVQLQAQFTAFTKDDEFIARATDRVDDALAKQETAVQVAFDALVTNPELAGCTVTVGGQVTVADEDGGFVMSNLAALNQPVKLTVVCDELDPPLFGESGYFLLLPQQSITLLPQIDVAPTQPPTTIAIAASARTATLTAIGQSVMIVTTAMLSDGTMPLVTRLADGVTYQSSAPAIVSVDAKGLATAVSSGVVFITVTKDGAASTLKLTVAPGDPLTTVQGTVVDATLRRVPGATVTTAAGFATTSLANGSFAIVGHTTNVDPLRVDANSGALFGFSLGNPIIPGGKTPIGTLVVDVDSDGDTLPDWYETNLFGTSPMLADTDGDGLTDNVEVLLLGTNPTSADSDGDGFDDQLENTLGSNPVAFDLPTTLMGQVKLPGNTPAAGADVTVLGVPAALFSAQADAGGVFTFTQPWPAGLSPVTLRATLFVDGEGSFAGQSDAAATVPRGVTVVGPFELGNAGGPLFPGAQYPAGFNPVSAAIADLNQDGLPDLAVANTGSNNVSVLLGLGDGTFSAAQNFGTGNSPISVAIADLNRDGIPDLAIANIGSHNVSVLLGLGGGTFAAAQNFAAGSTPRSVAIADLNQDGMPDLAVANQVSDIVSVLLGLGDGTFSAAHTFRAGFAPMSVAIADLNQDGMPDLAVANKGSHNVSVLLGLGDGTFSVAQNFGAGDNPGSVAIADLNQDGMPDLAVANESSDNVSVLLGLGDGTYSAARNFGAGDFPGSVAIADLNQDGLPDLAVANKNSDNVSVLLGLGDGTFAAAQNFGGGKEPRSMAIADLNQDGMPDLAVTNLSAVANHSSNTVWVLLGVGDGTFSAVQIFAADLGDVSVAIADLNQDGMPDLAVANAGSNNVSVLLGLGDGTFAAAQNFGVGSEPLSVAIADLNQDGMPDLAVANKSSNNVSVLLGHGDGTFATAQNLFGGLSFPISVAIADLNQDGIPDLAVANQGFGLSTVSVLLGLGDGSFSAAQNFGAGSHPNSVAIADLNQDGLPDLAVANGSSSNVSVLLGLGDGSFSAAQNFGANSPMSVAIADLNQDGLPDLAVANHSTSTVSVLIGLGDGTFSAAQNFGAGSFPRSVAIADLNQDGMPDLAVANGSSNNVSVLIGLGDGSFSAALHFGTGATSSVAIVDLNQDGLLDLVANLSVLLNQL